MIQSLIKRLNRIQNTRRFKIVAHAILALVVIGGFAAIWVTGNAPAATQPAEEAAAAAPPTDSWIDAGPIGIASRTLDNMLVQVTTTDGALAVAFAFFAAGVAAALIIELGLALSYLAILVVGWLIAWPFLAIDATQGLGQLIAGLVPLTLAFLTLIQGARVALFGSGPVIAIARNVLNEAVRMRISVVFIVILLVLMALVPGSLNEDQPLRFRVQQWLAYGLGFSYAVIALLTVFLAVATVAFEQRDKIIWQTATKPVSPLKYILGKWTGVMVLNAVLLAVSAGGVYLFTEFLRHQPANGESAYLVDLRGNSTRNNPASPPSLDRRILERQVLVARVAVQPEPREPNDLRINLATTAALADMEDPPPNQAQVIRREILDTWNESVEIAVAAEIEERRARDARVEPTVALQNKVRADLIKELEAQYRAIEPGQSEQYIFDTRDVYRKWVEDRERRMRPVAREVDRIIASGEATPEQRDQVTNTVLRRYLNEGKLPPFPEITLRYTIHAGTNDPTQIYRLYFVANGIALPANRENRLNPTEVALKASQTLTFPVTVLDTNNGVLLLEVISDPSNQRTLVFPPGDLEILHSVGGYELNFLRVIAIMWVKLGFIAAIGIAAATFLSFPVASLVTLGILFIAESAGFLGTSLEYFRTKDLDGNTLPINVIVKWVSMPIAWVFAVYAELKPTDRLADGRLISWSSLSLAIAVIGAWTAAILAVGLAIFRKRELAIYSGQ